MNTSNPCSIPVHCIAETEDFAVIWKPPRMHCAPVRQSSGSTLLEWYASHNPAMMELSGRKKGEGGLLHRLDFETQGLVLCAKNQPALDNLLDQQKQGNFIKEYSAVCHAPCNHAVIESFFQPFGPGRKMVRAVTVDCKNKKHIASDQGGYYRTEVIDGTALNNHFLHTLRLKRGFRHQIRCHLAWIGCPVVNDPLYGTGTIDGFLGLCATGLFFNDPSTGKPAEYHIESPYKNLPLEMPPEMP